jgi:hypothetical protein
VTPPITVKPLDEILPTCDVLIPMAPTNYGRLATTLERQGVMWHYDASSSDAGALGWFRSKEFKLSYNRAYTDNGRRVRLTPSIWHRAYHAGVCRRPPYDANLAFFGLAITAGAGDQATDAQFAAIVADTAVLFRYQGWPATDVEHRLVGHHEYAVFSKADAPTRPDLWGKLGRKPDPIGPNPNRPVLSLNSGRAAVAALLDAPDHDLWRRFP